MNRIVKSLLALLSGSVVLCAQDGPRISILGDSYSTFKGWIPAGHFVHYPCGRGNDVTRVEECWWYQVIDALHGKLEKNESWSGSTICYTGYYNRDYSSWCFESRTNQLGAPDIILVCGGTNDSWAGAPVGDYVWGDWKREQLYNFRPAMAKMTADLQKNYPKAKIYFVLNSELREDINDSVHEICRHYGVPCINLKDIHKQNSHPSVAGMKAMAIQVVQFIKADTKPEALKTNEPKTNAEPPAVQGK